MGIQLGDWAGAALPFGDATSTPEGSSDQIT